MFLSDFSIRRPVFTTCIMLALMVLGLFSVKGLGIDQYPNTDIPTVTVSIVYPGASPESVKQDVIKKIEEAVNPIEKIKEISSTSQESVGTLIIQFQLDRDVDKALDDVRTRIGQIRRNLPDTIEEPVISKFDPAQLPVLSLVVRPDEAHAGKIRDKELTRIAEDFLKRRLENVPGVGKVDVVGGSTREIQVQVDPQKLESLGLSLGQVMNAVGGDTSDVPSGNLLQGSREVAVKVDAKVRTVEAYRNVIVGNKQGRPIELWEVANVVDGVKEKRSLARLDGQDVVALEVQRQTGGNTVAMVESVNQVLKVLEPELKEQGVTLVTAKDNAKFISESVEDVEVAIYLGGLLTILIVFYFLKSWRSTLITSLTLPVSIVGTFIIMKAMNFTLNTMTLMGLSLAVGILIDDAIVVRENISRHAEMGKDHVTAAREGTAEIGQAVIATTLSILAVFVPVAFMGGIVGRFFFPFGITVAFAVALSLFVSFTLDPMLSAVWPDPEHEKHEESDKPRHRNAIMRSVDSFGRMLDGWELTYEKIIRWALAHRKATMAIGFGSFFLAMGLSGLLGNNFMPDYDRGDLAVTFKTAPGASLEATQAKALELELLVKKTEGVRLAYTTIGTGLSGSINQGGIYVKLEEGKRPSQVQIRRHLREAFRSVAGVETTVGAVNDFGAVSPIQLAIQGPDRAAVLKAEPMVKEALRQVPGAVDILSSLDQGKPELRLVVDRKAASDLGVSPALVAQMVRPLVDGRVVAKFEDETGEQRDVRVRLSDAGRRLASQLSMITVQSTKDLGGGKHPLIRLSQVARFEESIAPAKIQRHDLQEEIELDAGYEGSTLGEVSAGVAAKVVELQKSGQLPEGVRVEPLGQARDQVETGKYMGAALLLAVIFIYFVLASQFESFKLPITIMLSLPLSMVGMVLMLLVTGDSNSIMTSIGLILLMGLVTKNAILLVDNAIQHRKDGMDRTQALVHAGKTRLRPILMTTFAMIFGMLPLFFALGSGAEMRAPMARAVVGGIITSTLLTLIVVPVFYEILDDMTWRRLFTWAKGFLPRPSPTEGQS
ncbi:MAG: efflux RND transporter permease subunit [Acidobacteria bacterium]|nr:efflux RND transporter permease subunit [Acidobacteriota bacterium]